MNKAKLLNRTEGFKTYFNTLFSDKNGVNYNYYDSRTKYINGVYHVRPISITDYQVFICCPICHNFHAHGLNGGEYEGYRIKHCVGSTAGNKVYYIEKL